MQSLDRPLGATRTVLVTGFEDAAAYERYRDSGIPGDKILEHYTIPNSNFLFLIFYDVRDAIEFVKNFAGGPLRAQHTISKHEIPRRADECTERNLQSSIHFLFRGVDVGVEDAFMASFLRQYGEIREIRNSKPQQKTIEFFDRRSAVRAFEALNESTFGAGTVRCRWVWDLPMSHRAEYLRQTDELLRRSIPEEAGTPKRHKTNELAGTNGRNIFVALFDRFIGENISDVERLFR